MKTPLQLMIHGGDLEGARIRAVGDGPRIEGVHFGDSPNYMFADIALSEDTRPGNYTFEISKDGKTLRFDYEILQRRRDSAARKSFDSSDLVYLVMPDRFANGDPSNDSTGDTLEKSDRSRPDGRHGGDLQGVIDHLDYMADLGVTALWLTPPQLDNEPEASYHGYAAADYYRVDPRFGDNELYRQLVREAHKKGLKVIMDAVPNHCGTAHWWMKDLPFVDWVHDKKKYPASNYRLAALTDPNTSPGDFRQCFEGWFAPSMPDMAIENPFVLQYLLQVYVWWIEWADLDGLRVDTFPYNEKYAIARWTRMILEEYPGLRIVAECWEASPAIASYWEGASANADGYSSNLPSVMDFPLQSAISKGLKKGSDGWDGGMNAVYAMLAHDFLYADPQSRLVFLDNHDISRFADDLEGDSRRIMLGITLLATVRGIPQMTYGTEYMFRSVDTSQGDIGARIDFPGGWKGDRRNLFTGKGVRKREKEVWDHTRKLFNWRKGSKAIHK
ncbi:MAG: cyclomaltodextrinase N-terminal domain-containing protein [Alistipes sp.]|nr:cyclomaltodextrinase N-terminal domain-containing protein [Alistipes sp.]